MTHEALRDIANAIERIDESEEGRSSIEVAGETIARALDRLGNADAGTPMGGLEAHGVAMKAAAEIIAGSIGDLAEAIRESQARPIPSDSD